MTEDKEDGSIMASRNDYAQSKCSSASGSHSVTCLYKNCSSLYYCFRKINHLVPVAICIHPLMYVKPRREQTCPLASRSCLNLPPFICLNPSFYLLGDPASLLMVRIPIHSCPWFTINCSPFAASPTPRHPTDQVAYLH